MTDEYATLDEFTGAATDGESDGQETDGRSADERETGTQSADDPEADGQPSEPGESPSAAPTPVDPNGVDVDPAVVTSRWTGRGARCDGCDEHVERLWRDGERFVCGACKDW